MNKHAVSALAEAWASMDGRLDHFIRERDGKVGPKDRGYRGSYIGYLADAEELQKRLLKRGFKVTRIRRRSISGEAT